MNFVKSSQKIYVHDLCDIGDLVLFLFVFLLTGTYFSLITLLGVEHLKYCMLTL